MRNSIVILKQLFSQPVLSHSDIINMFTQIRIILRNEKKQESLKYLNLYCNWNLHDELSKSIFAVRILDQITDFLINLDKTKIIEEISNIISISGLRKDFIEFCDNFGFPKIIFTNQKNWEGFFILMVSHMINRSIVLPTEEEIKGKPKIKKLYDAIMEKAKANKNLGAKKFSFVEHKNINGEPALHWQVDIIRPRIYIVSPLYIPKAI